MTSVPNQELAKTILSFSIIRLHIVWLWNKKKIGKIAKGEEIMCVQGDQKMRWIEPMHIRTALNVIYGIES